MQVFFVFFFISDVAPRVPRSFLVTAKLENINKLNGFQWFSVSQGVPQSEKANKTNGFEGFQGVAGVDPPAGVARPPWRTPMFKLR